MDEVHVRGYTQWSSDVSAAGSKASDIAFSGQFYTVCNSECEQILRGHFLLKLWRILTMFRFPFTSGHIKKFSDIPRKKEIEADLIHKLRLF